MPIYIIYGNKTVKHTRNCRKITVTTSYIYRIMTVIAQNHITYERQEPIKNHSPNIFFNNRPSTHR